MHANLALLTGILLTACAPDTPPDEAFDELSAHLERGVDIHAYAGGSVEITGRYTAGHIDRAGRVSIPIMDAVGRAQVDPDGALRLEELQLWLDDIVVTPNTVPIHLTGMSVTLIEPASALPRYVGFDLGAMELRVPVMVQLDWAIYGSSGYGVIAPLAPARIGPLQLVIRFRLNETGLVIGQVWLTAEGEVWNWAGLLHLSDPAAVFEITDHPRVAPVE